MKKLCFVILCIVGLHSSKAQEALHNYGFLKIHEMGAIGFHHDLINDGITDDNQGLAGFFSNENIIISGAFRPIFRDMEIMVNKDLFLEIGVGVTNNTNFILGDVVTPRSLPYLNLDYINDAFYNGDKNVTKVDGYAALASKGDFIFPIGYGDRLRPLEIISKFDIPRARSAYFFENPNSPLTFNTSFDTNSYEAILTSISNEEFWDLDSETISRVRLTWTPESQIQNLVNTLDNLRVVGWHKIDREWKNLGNIAISGDFSEGYISSDIFLPDDYSIITFGGGFTPNDVQLANYILTPNGDGTNDFLVFKEIALSPNNQLEIFNRWGRLVYNVENYTNSFQGKANVSAVVEKNTILPAGIYFYILQLSDIGITHQGYLYITD
ncbi:gliding motility-associated C-terminal domain-containing protein [Maribacter sp. 2308TA10-17]|uniref:gliding motility-associated C-terminal domain-containing protein n=1 Tax=Maribacter sp. 2308TA10-17 TaxID=3386276 RepID=UPI0039BD623A